MTLLTHQERTTPDGGSLGSDTEQRLGLRSLGEALPRGLYVRSIRLHGVLYGEYALPEDYHHSALNRPV